MKEVCVQSIGSDVRTAYYWLGMCGNRIWSAKVECYSIKYSCGTWWLFISTVHNITIQHLLPMAEATLGAHSTALLVKMDDAKRVRTSERRKLNRAIKLFEESVKQDDPTEILKPAFDEICGAYKRLENANDDFISCIDVSCDEYASLLAVAEDYITEVYRLKCKAHSQLLRKIDGDKSKQKADNTKFIVKKLEPPKFDGQIRLYPTFK
ncbi:hypothetical protein Pcinc_001040 [Petrolisthes cinctipes]|uniref:Uncharacterized protein n=1 Tax=Petrolisthes cinctipes TaxID=88211 RepID=A0AAE1L658_PETCI|nr:hypothetical protein Pcinc_001040 [Petrolisthes cinctipes]